jgi:hypothetical protein
MVGILQISNRQYMNYRSFAIVIMWFTLAIAIFFLIIFIHWTPVSLLKNPIESKYFADYGALIGGLAAAALGIASILMLIQTLNDQKKSGEIQQIESKFFELIKLHRENVSEFESKGKVGRNVIVAIYDEFNALYNQLGTFYIDSFKKFQIDNNKELNKDDIRLKKEAAEITYNIIFYGVNSMVREEVKEKIKKIIGDDEYFNKSFLSEFNMNIIYIYDNIKEYNQNIDLEYNRNLMFNIQKQKREKQYLPYDGHQSRLGHYFRHLFQAVKFINEQPEKLVDFDRKYLYIKTLRAQLSTHEQAILFYNSLTDLGAPWELSDKITEENKKLITKYNFIKNLPKNFTNNLNPKDHYPFIFYEIDDKEPEERENLRNIYKER